MKFKLVAKSDIKYILLLFAVVCLLFWYLYGLSEWSVFAHVKIPEGETVTINTEFGADMLCTVYPYEKTVHIQDGLDENIRSKLHEYLNLNGFEGNGEYELTLLMSDASAAHVQAVTIPPYASGVKFATDLQGEFKTIDESCVFFQTTKAVYLSR